jgi:hypothetical protein
LPLGATWLVLRRRIGLQPWRVMGLGVTVTVAAICCAWLALQVRWLGYASVALVAVALVLCPTAPARGRSLADWPWALLALTVPGWAIFALEQSNVDYLRQAENVFGWVPTMAEVGWNVRLYHGDDSTPARVAAPMSDSTVLRYYGGCYSLGSLYWENNSGCRTLVKFLDDDAPGEPEARRIARDTGLEYVVVTSNPQSVTQAQFLDRGAVDHATLGRTLVFRLANPLHPRPPDWLEPLPLLDAPLATAAGVRLYRVVPERL